MYGGKRQKWRGKERKMREKHRKGGTKKGKQVEQEQGEEVVERRMRGIKRGKRMRSGGWKKDME